MLYKSKLIILLTIFILFFTASCGESHTNDNYVTTVIDSNNREIGFDEYPKDAVALGYSIADIWMEAGGSIVGGTSDILDYENIDMTVIGTMENVSFELIISLQPDLVLLNSNVSAHKQLSSKLDKVGIAYYFVEVNDFDDYLYTLKNFTLLTENDEMYELNGLRTKEQVDSIITSVPENVSSRILLVRTSASTFKTLSSSHFVGAMLKDLGTDNIADSNNDILENMNIEAIVSENPEYLFITMMGSEDAAKTNFYNHINSNPLWKTVDAIKNDKVYFLPKEWFQSKPNSNWGDAYEYLAKILFEE